METENTYLIDVVGEEPLEFGELVDFIDQRERSTTDENGVPVNVYRLAYNDILTAKEHNYQWFTLAMVIRPDEPMLEDYETEDFMNVSEKDEEGQSAAEKRWWVDYEV